MAMVSRPDQLTPREREEFEQEKEVIKMQSDHTLAVKQLDVEVAKIEARWTILLKLPLYLILLPVRILFAFAYIIAVATKQELPKEFWDYMK